MSSSLMEYLRRHKEDRGAMADFRCAVVKSRQYRAWPHLAILGLLDDPVAMVIMGLYGYHPEESSQGNFGDVCRLLAGNPSLSSAGKEIGVSPMERHFQHLLASTREELGNRLLRLVLRAKAEGIPVNYEELENDMRYWGEKVRLRWAARFWSGGWADDTVGGGEGDGGE